MKKTILIAAISSIAMFSTVTFASVHRQTLTIINNTGVPITFKSVQQHCLEQVSLPSGVSSAKGNNKANIGYEEKGGMFTECGYEDSDFKVDFQSKNSTTFGWASQHKGNGKDWSPPASGSTSPFVVSQDGKTFTISTLQSKHKN